MLPECYKAAVVLAQFYVEPREAPLWRHTQMNVGHIADTDLQALDSPPSFTTWSHQL